MILGNFNVFNKNPGRAIGGPSDPTLWFKPGTIMDFYTPIGNNISTVGQSSFPYGSKPPYSFILSPKGGGMSSKVNGAGVINTTTRLKGNKAMSSPLSGVGVINPSALGLIVGMVSELDGTGLLSGSVSGGASMTAALLGEGDINASIGALANLTTALNGSGNIVANLRAIGFMIANLTPFTTLSPESLATSLWNSLAAEYNNTGTMGEKLNSAGSAGDPWITDLSSYNTNGTAGKMIKQIKSIGQAGL